MREAAAFRVREDQDRERDEVEQIAPRAAHHERGGEKDEHDAVGRPVEALVPGDGGRGDKQRKRRADRPPVAKARERKLDPAARLELPQGRLVLDRWQRAPQSPETITTLRLRSMDVRELAPGLWRWTGWHEEWKQEVGCVYYEHAGEVCLIDPLVPPEDPDRFWAALDRDVERAGGSVHVLLTVFWHARSAGEVVARYGARK